MIEASHSWTDKGAKVVGRIASGFLQICSTDGKPFVVVHEDGRVELDPRVRVELTNLTGDKLADLALARACREFINAAIYDLERQL